MAPTVPPTRLFSADKINRQSHLAIRQSPQRACRCVGRLGWRASVSPKGLLSHISPFYSPTNRTHIDLAIGLGSKLSGRGTARGAPHHASAPTPGRPLRELSSTISPKGSCGRDEERTRQVSRRMRFSKVLFASAVDKQGSSRTYAVTDRSEMYQSSRWHSRLKFSEGLHSPALHIVVAPCIRAAVNDGRNWRRGVMNGVAVPAPLPMNRAADRQSDKRLDCLRSSPTASGLLAACR